MAVTVVSTVAIRIRTGDIHDGSERVFSLPVSKLPLKLAMQMTDQP